MSANTDASEAASQVSEENPSENQMKEAEKSEEAKLRAKYPQVLRPGGSVFLQKRLQKGQKYFDSGDYNMAKARGNARPAVPVVAQQAGIAAPVGNAIPTPEDLPARKTSIVQSKLATELS
ncbi:cAMP-regulated phosphoprotein 19-like [Argiope bruennichi]|uniref:cAMP-regulated phosphoprotein 19 like protein n=1 Tax=Argiope bruennichi TaxID=94029 RepID=A0A8T0EII7_ARGBR|nr:cAMP-regulated phosphoprotein 19-like [Argiope bruennichi]KAF8773717.1 cAMP-regulated phosphoprotein 19 like protein [Argiope bruennichi]